MLPLLKDLLENRTDAFARALAAAESHISSSGGSWYGVGAKGSFLLLGSTGFTSQQQRIPYRRTGHEMLKAALQAAQGASSHEAHLLQYLAGCAYAATASDGAMLTKATQAFETSDMGHTGLATWCADWCRILLASGAQSIGDAALSETHFRVVSNRDPEHAAALFECWSTRAA
ncbi:MAG: hypothetical protein N4A53_06165 [Pelagimonas sp.]|jgi:hypothetical protein|nr:hypothetical protein [Pelagimonas sp.]